MPLQDERCNTNSSGSAGQCHPPSIGVSQTPTQSHQHMEIYGRWCIHILMYFSD